MAKRKELTNDDLINWWLEKYHNTNMDGVLKDNPDWDIHSKEWNSRTFYQKYPVTQEQHDEWEKWAFNAFTKHFRVSKTYAKRAWPYTYLNVSPSIKKVTQEDNNS